MLGFIGYHVRKLLDVLNFRSDAQVVMHELLAMCCCFAIRNESMEAIELASSATKLIAESKQKGSFVKKVVVDLIRTRISTPAVVASLF